MTDRPIDSVANLNSHDGDALLARALKRARWSILWERLQIPNQTGAVRSELALALEALGQRTSAGNGGSVLAARPGPAHRDGRPGNPGNGQGD